jgi:hypothetical protein
MREALLLLIALATGCASRSSAPESPACTVCRIEVRNQGSVAMELRLDDLENGPMLGTVAPRGVQEFTIERRPERLYGVFFRDMQRYVRPCSFSGMSGEVYRYTCRGR